MRKAKHQIVIYGASVALGLALFGATYLRPVKPLIPVAQAAQIASIERVDLGGEDVARLLKLKAFKWQYNLPEVPKGQKVSGVFWMEEWKRNDKQPKITSLFSMGLFEPKGNLLVKMPTSKTDELVVTTNGTTLSQSGATIPMTRESFTVAMGNETLTLDDDLILFASAHNAKGGYSSANNRELPRTNDHNVYFKVRFTTSSKTSPIWKNGKIALEN